MNEKKLLQQLAGTDYRVRVLYNKLIAELAKVGKKIQNIPDDELFSFDDYPSAAREVASCLNQYAKAIQNTLMEQIKNAFNVAYQLQNAFLGDKSVLHGKSLTDLRKTSEQAFLESRLKPQRGMGLSDRIWNYTNQAKAEFEAGMSQLISDGLVSGKSAEELGRNLRQMLQKPDEVYRRYHLKKTMKNGSKRDVIEWRKKVVDEDGKVHFVQTDMEKVGRGVYRSSRQNALRLAATEINMAYRYADYERWQNEPFVIGIRISLSNNHTLNGKPFHDMCDDLVGDYPKDFYFPGWHPRCRCTATAITISDEEMDKIAFLSEEDYANYKSPNLITRVPYNFENYCEANADKLVMADERQTLPYWARDNRKYIPQLEQPVQPVKTRSKEEILNAAKIRHANRTPEQAKDIQVRWDRRYISRNTLGDFTEPPKVGDIWNDRPQLEKWVTNALNVAGRYFPNGIGAQDISTLRFCYDKYGKGLQSIYKSISANVPKMNEWLSKLNLNSLHDDAVIRLASYMRQYKGFAINEDIIKSLNATEGIKNLKALVKAKVDFNLISANMPVELIPNGKWLGDSSHVFSRELFDQLPEFVRLKISNAGKVAFSSSQSQQVSLFTGDSRAVRASYRQKVVYHEFGHQVFDFKKLASNAELTDFVEKWDNEFKKIGYANIEKKLRDFRNLLSVNNRDGLYSIMDTVQAISKGKYGCLDIDGHSASYWKRSKENPLTELFAHISETYHGFNRDEFRYIFGDNLADEITGMWRKLVK